MKKYLFFVVILKLFVLEATMIAQIENHTIRLRPFDYSETISLYVVDGLKLNSEWVTGLPFERRQIQNFSFLTSTEGIAKYGNLGEYGVIEIHTRLLLVLNGKVYHSFKDKHKVLSEILKDDIISIELMDRSAARKIYGRSARFGAIFVVTH